MITIFEFLRVWDTLTPEEKDYLAENYWSSSYKKVEERDITEIEKSLMEKDVLYLKEFQYYGEHELQLNKEMEWIFRGMSLRLS